MRKHVVQLLSGLPEGVRQALSAPSDLLASLPDELTGRIKRLPLDIGDKLGPGAVLQSLQLARSIHRLKADIIHCHGYKAAAVGSPAAWLAGSRSIITGHNLFPTTASAAARTALRITARLSERIIAVAPAVASSLIQAGIDEQKIIVIPNGVDLNVYTNRKPGPTRSALGVDDSSPIILCAARLTEVKGVEYLIRAAALVNEHHPGIRVMIAGDGPDRKALVDLAEDTAPGIVTFLGHRDDLPQLLAASDVIAIPSLAEGLPLMLVESMAAGKPIVASRVGGLADVIKDGKTGLLVSPADPSALAEALMAVVKSPELAARFGTQARLAAEQEFSLDKMIERTKEVYLCVLS